MLEEGCEPHSHWPASDSIWRKQTRKHLVSTLQTLGNQLPRWKRGQGGGSGLTVCIALPRAGLGLACGHREAPCCSPSCPVAPSPALSHRPADACPAAGSIPGPLAAFLQAELASRCFQKGLCSPVCVCQSSISTLWRKSCPHVPGVGASGMGRGDGMWSWLHVHPEVG